MSTAISMLRGINVGGQKKVAMDELKACYESLGLANVKTYIQSGNVIFEHRSADKGVLIEKLERGIRARFGFEVAVTIRTKEEMRRVIENLPFEPQKKEKAHVTFLFANRLDVPSAEIDKMRAEGEEYSISGAEIYLFLPHGYGRTKLSNSFFERKLKVLATTRNWRTVETLNALAQG
jgi:uncharacterized protein (DUF1697 family)